VVKQAKNQSRRTSSVSTIEPPQESVETENRMAGPDGSDGATPYGEPAFPDRAGCTPDGSAPPGPEPREDGDREGLQIHPLAELMPPMPEAVYEKLKESIRNEGGNLVPIYVTRSGEVLDGRNRYRACRELGLEPATKEWDGRGSEIDAVLALNDLRRQSNDSQRALFAAGLVGRGRGRPAKNARIRAITLEEATRRVGVKKTLVQAALTVLRRGVPGLVDLVHRGEVKASAAALVAGLKPAEQDRLVAGGAKAVRSRAAVIRSEDKSQRARAERSPESGARHEVEHGAAADDQPGRDSAAERYDPGAGAEQDELGLVTAQGESQARGPSSIGPETSHKLSSLLDSGPSPNVSRSTRRRGSPPPLGRRMTQRVP